MNRAMLFRLPLSSLAEQAGALLLHTSRGRESEKSKAREVLMLNGGRSRAIWNRPSAAAA